MTDSQEKATEDTPPKRGLVAPSDDRSPASPIVSPETTVKVPVDDKGDGNGLPPPLIPPTESRGDVSLASLTPRTLMNALSVEAVLYALIFLAALVLRFIDLGGRPLGRSEAEGAIAAWQLLQRQASGFVGSPFLFTSNLLLFFLGGATDATVRIIPASIGSTLVLLPAFLRRELGRTGALVSSVLLLFSCTLVFFSREANGVEISAAAGFAAAIGLWRYSALRRARDLYAAAVLAAIALTASAAGFTLLLTGLVFSAFFRWVITREKGKQAQDPTRVPLPEDGHERPDPDDSRPDWRNAVFLFAATYVAIATAFTFNRPGLGAAFDLLGSWVSSFQTLGPITSPLNLLPVYEPLVFVFGFAGLVLLTGLRGDEFRSQGLLVYFALVLVLGGLIYSVSGSKSAANIVVLVIPLAILAGWMIGSLLERGIQDLAAAGGWRAAAYGELPILSMALALFALIYLQLVTLVQQNRFSPNIDALRQLLFQGTNPGAFGTALILLAVFAMAFGTFLVLLALGSIGSTRAANLGALFVVIILGLSGVRALWLANFSVSYTVDEIIAGQQTSLQARDLVNDLEWLSAWREIDPHVIQVRADERLSAVVRWYLRGFKNIQWQSNPQADSPGEALLTTADAPAPAGAWVDQRYNIGMDWQPVNLAGETLWRWLLFRDGGVENWQSVRLWAPNPQ